MKSRSYKSKKGQTEDIIADLLPALVITVIAIFLMGEIKTEHKEIVGERIVELRAQAESSIDYVNFLRTPSLASSFRLPSLSEALSSAPKDESCSDPRMTTADMISKIDPDKALKREDACYDVLVDHINTFNGKYLKNECFKLNLIFPGQKEVPVHTQCNIVTQTEKSFKLPLKNGDYVDVTFLVGMVLPSLPMVT